MAMSKVEYAAGEEEEEAVSGREEEEAGEEERALSLSHVLSLHYFWADEDGQTNRRTDKICEVTGENLASLDFDYKKGHVLWWAKKEKWYFLTKFYNVSGPIWFAANEKKRCKWVTRKRNVKV